MLPPEPAVLAGRQGFLDAQAAFADPSSMLGLCPVSWYGTAVSDERGSFALVDPLGKVADRVGDILAVTCRGRTVYVYVIGSAPDLGADLALTRRAYLAISVLAIEPITATIGLVATAATVEGS